MLTRTALLRILLVSLALFAAATACNLQRQSDDVRTTPSPSAERPTVEILEPAAGASVTKGLPVSVKARATGGSGVTLIELRVNNTVVDSQVPAEQIAPTTLDVVLDYTPEQAGTAVLTVTAYTNSIAGQPATRTITVVDTLDAGAGGSGSSTTTHTAPAVVATVYNPLCRARINVALNFRRGPGVAYDIISTVSAGSELPIAGYADVTDGRWWQVSWGGQFGWVKESYTEQMGDCSAIRPATVPVSPTPQPSETPVPTQPGATATPTLPDLRLSVLDGPRDITLGADGKAQATYNIAVRNDGGQTSGQFNLAVALPTGQIQDLGVVAGLAGGQQVSVPSGGLVVTFDSPGIKRLLVTVDQNNVVAESNESNNQAYLDITVNGTAQPASSNNQQNGQSVAALPQPTLTPVPTSAPAVAQEAAPQEAIPLAEQGVQAQDDAQPQVEQFDAQADAMQTDQQTESLSLAAPVESVGTDLGAPQPLNAGNAASIGERTTLIGHSGAVSALAFNPSGTLLASASWDGTARLWDVATGAEIIDLVGHMDRVTDVVFSADGARVATASWDGTVRLWEASTGFELASFAHGAEVNSVALSQDGTRIAAGGINASGGGDGQVHVWDTASGAELAAITVGGPVTDLALPGGDQVVIAAQSSGCGTANGSAGIWSMSSGAPSVEMAGHSGSVNAVALGGGRLAGAGQAALCSGSAVIWIWDAGSGALQTTLDQGTEAAIRSLALSPAGDLVASASADGAVRVWSAGGGSPLAVLSGHVSEATSVAFSPAGTLIASGGGDNTIRLWGTL
ncbi:CARDB domain-containing protein [Aggregatilinea lenta]|uniref:CARDB domain-containing protein n=1 Tax=Aggregatilinea lenta TaxID=913108 RepID=UPI000E5A2564|nr:CARDB domain-containing protein [Aggregatilinea lenta]